MKDIVNDYLLQSLVIGVPYEVFWKLNPKKLKPFFHAHEIREHMKVEQAWLHGVYVLEAISAVFGKGHRYPEIPSFKKEAEVAEVKIDREEQAKNEAKIFSAYVTKFNKNFKQTHSNE